MRVPFNYEPSNAEKFGALSDGRYFIRPWASSYRISQGPWEAWYELIAEDRSTLLFGPTSAGEFVDGREAVKAAELAASRYVSKILASLRN
jgi:hypothetical protein